MTLIDFGIPKWQNPKTWLGKCEKSHVWEDPSKSNMVTGLNTVEICTTAYYHIYW